jgi:hypothetical protein
VAFGDFLVESHRYVLRVSPQGRLTVGHELDIDDEEDTLESFFRRYIDRPETMPVIVDPDSGGRSLT